MNNTVTEVIDNIYQMYMFVCGCTISDLFFALKTFGPRFTVGKIEIVTLFLLCSTSGYRVTW